MGRAGKNRRTNRSTLITIFFLLMVIGVGLFGIHLWEKHQQEAEAARYSGEDPAVRRLTIEYQNERYVLRDDLDTYLLIGLDKFTDTLSDPGLYTNNQQADFLFLMVVDKTAKSYSAIHINRDTMAEIHRLGMSGKKIGTFIGQLALSHTFGSGGKDSCRNTAASVSHYLLDVPVEHYFSVTMDAIPVLNDLVGGVTVLVEDDFSAVDPTLKQGERIRLQGQQALRFVRARQQVGDKSNLSRMDRQRVYVHALYEQMTEKLHTEDGFAVELASQLSEYSVSDLTTTELANLAEKLKDYSFNGIETIAGEAVQGEQYMEFYADEEELKAMLVRVLFKRAGS